MKRCCETCGYRSASEVLFRRERGGLFNRHKWVCDGCVAYQATSSDRRSFWNWLFLWLTWFALFGVGAVNMRAQVGLAMIFVAAMVVAGPLTTTMHELGHALFARFAGLEVVSVSIGGGPMLRSLRLGSARIYFHRYFFIGGLTKFVDLRPRHSLWRDAIATAGGPATNAVAFLLLMKSAAAISTIEYSQFARAGSAVLAGVAVSQGLAAFFNLAPRTGRNGLASDGLRLIQLLIVSIGMKTVEHDQMTQSFNYMLARKFDLAEQAFRKITASHRAPTDADADADADGVSVLSLILHCSSRSKGDVVAFRDYIANKDVYERAALLSGDASKAQWPWVQANIAWLALKGGDRSDLPLAARLAREALEAAPEAPEMKGTMGAVLVEEGMFDEGIALLTDAARTVADPIDKRDFCVFLAKAERERGNTVRAEEFEGLSRHLSASV